MRENVTGPRYEQEPCFECQGAGDVDYGGERGWDFCEACNGTGLLYTENAIRLQVEAEDAESRLHGGS